MGNYKRMMAECQQIAAKIQEVIQCYLYVLLFKVSIYDTSLWFDTFQLTVDRDEHKLVVETMSKLEAERKAFRLVGGVLVERTVGEVLPAVSQNYEGVGWVVCLLVFGVRFFPLYFVLFFQPDLFFICFIFLTISEFYHDFLFCVCFLV